MKTLDDICQELEIEFRDWECGHPYSYQTALLWIYRVYHVYHHVLRLEEFAKIHGPSPFLYDARYRFEYMCESVLCFLRDQVLTDYYARFLILTENGVTTKGSLSHQ